MVMRRARRRGEEALFSLSRSIGPGLKRQLKALEKPIQLMFVEIQNFKPGWHGRRAMKSSIGWVVTAGDLHFPGLLDSQASSRAGLYSIYTERICQSVTIAIVKSETWRRASL